jgi:hypothetical protein
LGDLANLSARCQNAEVIEPVLAAVFAYSSLIAVRQRAAAKATGRSEILAAQTEAAEYVRRLVTPTEFYCWAKF